MHLRAFGDLFMKREGSFKVKTFMTVYVTCLDICSLYDGSGVKSDDELKLCAMGCYRMLLKLENALQGKTYLVSTYYTQLLISLLPQAKGELRNRQHLSVHLSIFITLWFPHSYS